MKSQFKKVKQPESKYNRCKLCQSGYLKGTKHWCHAQEKQLKSLVDTVVPLLNQLMPLDYCKHGKDPVKCIYCNPAAFKALMNKIDRI